MDRVPITTTRGLLVSLEERDVIRGCRVIVNALDANIHRPHVDIQLFNLRKKVEQVVRSEGQLCRLDRVRFEAETSEGEGRGESAGRRVCVGGGAGRGG